MRIYDLIRGYQFDSLDQAVVRLSHESFLVPHDGGAHGAPARERRGA